jgi:DNA-binding beta-propeller fold protein YncE
MTRKFQIAIIILFAALASYLPVTALAEVDWEVANAVQLDETPLDVAHTQNSEYTFILTDQAKVLIYTADNKLAGTVPVDPSVTDIAVSAKGDQLYLINAKRKTLNTLDINFIVDINVAGSPFLGPAGAKVTVAVFSDFQ